MYATHVGMPPLAAWAVSLEPAVSGGWRALLAGDDGAQVRALGRTTMEALHKALWSVAGGDAPYDDETRVLLVRDAKTMKVNVIGLSRAQGQPLLSPALSGVWLLDATSITRIA